MPRLFRFILLLSMVLIHGVTSAWEVPDHWAELGTVEEWMERDAEIWRFEGETYFRGGSLKHLDQRSLYQETFTYLGSMEGISLAGYLALDPGEQEQRIGAARRHRNYLLRFRNRLGDYVHRSRANLPTGWGMGVADVSAVGEHLKHLRSAVALDPANVHAWHLYAMFATIVGDTGRALDALDGATAALAQVPAGELTGIRARVALDRAWLLRDRGDLAGAREAVNVAVAHDGPAREAILLRGLLAARSGDIQTAVEMSRKLRATEIGKWPAPVSAEPPGSRPNFWRPEHTNMGAWKQVPSDYLQNWIMALAWLQEGRADMAAMAFRKYDMQDSYAFGWRFWREAGRIYEVTGRPATAQLAWRTARVWAPYSVYYPTKTYTANPSRLTGRPARYPVYRAFDRFYVSGHRLLPGMILVQQMAEEQDELKRLELAGRATFELESCRDSDAYPAQASLLLGSVYHLMGDLQSAVLAVEAALNTLAGEGDAPGQRAVLAELDRLNADHSTTGVQRFYGQSGSARSRWEPTADPEAERSALQAAYDADAGHTNRRNLARYLVRHEEAEAGRDLVAAHASGHPADMAILLEAERNRGESAQAEALVAGLRGGDDPFDDAEVWTLAGFICLDVGLVDEARIALDRALELDPGNRALRTQMKLLG